MPDLIDRFRYLFYAVLAVPLVVGLGFLVLDRLDEDPQPLVIESTDEQPGAISVYVTGAVQSPGVYPLAAGSRWIDAVEAAGGPAADADLESVNLALRILDEAQIVVPHIDAGVAAAAPAAPGPIDLNSADLDALESLPGIGEVRAERILSSRQEDGPFAQVDDLILRDLVPSSVFQDILPLVVVN